MYHTLLIKMANQTYTHTHYVLSPFNTVCGKSLENAQIQIEYELKENKLCPECKKAEPVPSIKEWSYTTPIKTKKQAFQSLSCLYIFYQMLDKEFRICQSLEESGTFKSNVLTNHFLMDEEPKIEKIEEGKIELSYSEENKRVKKTVSYERVGMIMKNVKKDILIQFEIKRN